MQVGRMQVGRQAGRYVSVYACTHVRMYLCAHVYMYAFMCMYMFMLAEFFTVQQNAHFLHDNNLLRCAQMGWGGVGLGGAITFNCSCTLTSCYAAARSSHCCTLTSCYAT